MVDDWRLAALAWVFDMSVCLCALAASRCLADVQVWDRDDGDNGSGAPANPNSRATHVARRARPPGVARLMQTPGGSPQNRQPRPGSANSAPAAVMEDDISIELNSNGGASASSLGAPSRLSVGESPSSQRRQLDVGQSGRSIDLIYGADSVRCWLRVSSCRFHATL